MHHRILPVAPLAVAILVVVACGGGGDASDEAQAEAAQDATARTAECQQPPELPEDTPLPPGCTYVFDPTDIGGSYLIIEARSTAPQDEVVAFFEEEMAARRWDITAKDDRDDGGVSLSMARDDDRMFLEIYPGSGGDYLTVQYVLD